MKALASRDDEQRLRRAVAEAERVLDAAERSLVAYGDFERDVRGVLEDRARLLGLLDLTEHEWACRGGRRFDNVEFPSDMRDFQVPLRPDHVREKWEGGEDFLGAVRAARRHLELVGDRGAPEEEEVVAESAPEESAPESAAVDSPSALEPPPIPTELAEPRPVPPPPPIPTELAEPRPVPPPPPAPRAPDRISWTQEQERALDAVEEWGPERASFPALDSFFAPAGPALDNFFALTGSAGTGKSTLVREIVDRHPNAVLAAMTGKAALRLAECAGRPAATLHSVLYYPPRTGEEVKFTRLREPTTNFLVVDEASMITPSVFYDMQRWARDGVRFLLVGDPYQLPPVITAQSEREMYGEDYSVFAEVGGAALRTVMRSAGGVLRASERVRETGQLPEESDDGYEFARVPHPIERAVADYCADPDDHLLVTWRNAARMAANRMIRERIGRGGPVPDEGEPVLIKKNGQGLLNGEIVTCEDFEAGPKVGSVQCLWMRCRTYLGNSLRALVSYEGREEHFDGALPKVENWSRYHVDLKREDLPEPIPVTWGYCLTAHAAQGSESRRVTVFLDRGDQRSENFRKPTTLPTGEQVPFSARWLYTALTRSKRRATMVVGR